MINIEQGKFYKEERVDGRSPKSKESTWFYVKELYENRDTELETERGRVKSTIVEFLGTVLADDMPMINARCLIYIDRDGRSRYEYSESTLQEFLEAYDDTRKNSEEATSFNKD